MQKRIRTFLLGILIMIFLPVILTMFLQPDAELTKNDGESLYLEGSTEDNGIYHSDIEGKVIAVVAKEISIGSETEAIKAQAVIARTNLLCASLSGAAEPEGLTTDEMMTLYGEERFAKCYERLAACVKETAALVLTKENKMIEAPYFAVSAGKTRSALDAFGKEEISYLKSIDSKWDIESSDYLRVLFLEKEDFTKQCKTLVPKQELQEEQPLEQIEILSRDEAEYVKELRIGEVTVSGEEFRQALGLASACFSVKEVEGKIRIVTKGMGHGVGLSQYGANALAAEGKTCEEILKTYFTGVELMEAR